MDRIKGKLSKSTAVLGRCGLVNGWFSQHSLCSVRRVQAGYHLEPGPRRQVRRPVHGAQVRPQAHPPLLGDQRRDPGRDSRPARLGEEGHRPHVLPERQRRHPAPVGRAVPKPKPKWNLHRHRIGRRYQHRLSGERRNPGNSAECAFLDNRLLRCDERFCSFRLCKLTHCQLPQQTLWIG